MISGDDASHRKSYLYFLTRNTVGRLARFIHKFKETVTPELHGPATSSFLSHCVDIRYVGGKFPS